MNKLWRRINCNQTLTSSAILVASSFLIVAILGIIRTKLINAHFNDFATGAYIAAFKIPDLFYYTLAGGALSVAFIPVLSDKIFSAHRQQAWRLTASVLNSLALLMFFVCLALILFPKPILQYVIAPGFSEARLEVATQIMRLVAINPLVFAVTSILAGVQQVFRRFFFYALAPLFYNLSIIASIYLFKSSMGVIGLGVGVIIGALLNLVILGIGMNQLKSTHYWWINLKDKAFLQVAQALPIRSVSQSVVYINSIVQTRIASTLSINAVTNFEFALILYNAPITLLGATLGVVAFPRFAKNLSQKNYRIFEKDFLDILKLITWLVIPIVALSFFGRHYLANIIFSRGNEEIALIFGWLSLGILFQTLYIIIARFYYAQKDMMTPFLVTVIAFFSSILLSWFLSLRYGVLGLGLATSLVAILEVFILLLIINRRYPTLFNQAFLSSWFKILGLGLITVLVAYFSATLLPLNSLGLSLELILKLIIITLITLIAHLTVGFVFKIKEMYRVLHFLQPFCYKLRNKLFKK